MGYVHGEWSPFCGEVFGGGKTTALFGDHK